MCIYKTTATSPYWKHKTNCTFLRIAVTSKANKAAKQSAPQPSQGKSEQSQRPPEVCAAA